MTDRKVVMISSTALDLPKHRDQVRLACERAGFEPRMMMENLTARNTDAVDISMRMVDKAGVHLGIFAYRYGYVPDGPSPVRPGELTAGAVSQPRSPTCFGGD